MSRGARDAYVEVGRHGAGDLGDADAWLVLHRDQHLVDRHGGADPIATSQAQEKSKRLGLILGSASFSFLFLPSRDDVRP